MERRKFIKQTTIGAGSLLTIPSIVSGGNSRKRQIIQETGYTPISQIKKPLAIAMWDFSWILRHHKYGSFENWDRVLGELAERGYNAIRFDVMPQFVVSSKEGKVIDEFRSVKEDWKPVMWGNDISMSFRPREAFLEFLLILVISKLLKSSSLSKTNPFRSMAIISFFELRIARFKPSSVFKTSSARFFDGLFSLISFACHPP